MIPQIASEPLTFERGMRPQFSLHHVRHILTRLTSGLDGDQDESYGGHHAENEPAANPDQGQVLRATVGPSGDPTRDRVRTGERPPQPSEGHRGHAEQQTTAADALSRGRRVGRARSS